MTTPTTEEYGPGKHGWPAHGYTDTRGSKCVCYCGEEFAAKMYLNQHIWAEARADLAKRIVAAVEKQWAGRGGGYISSDARRDILAIVIAEEVQRTPPEEAAR